MKNQSAPNGLKYSKGMFLDTPDTMVTPIDKFNVILKRLLVTDKIIKWFIDIKQHKNSLKQSEIQ